MTICLNVRQQKVIIYIKYTDVFDRPNHKFITMRKTKSLFRSIYTVTQGSVGIQEENDKFSISKTFKMKYGTVRVHVFNPILFIITLNHLVKNIDTIGKGIKIGGMK